jgi:hypothetical protein
MKPFSFRESGAASCFERQHLASRGSKNIDENRCFV